MSSLDPGIIFNIFLDFSENNLSSVLGTDISERVEQIQIKLWI